MRASRREPKVIILYHPRKGRRVNRTLPIPERVYQRVLTGSCRSPELDAFGLEGVTRLNFKFFPKCAEPMWPLGALPRDYVNIVTDCIQGC